MKATTLIVMAAAALAGHAQTFVETDAYRWTGDTIVQGEFRAWAPSANELVSTYHAQPGYFMPIDQRWTPRNDISAYPQLLTPNTLHTAIYNLGLDEMVNAVEPDTTLRTGREWPGVWTRDVSYSILLSMAYMQPEATRQSLLRKVDRLGRIIQDTGSGGAWPVSTDRMIWAAAAYEYYLVTGDRKWLEFIYPVIKQSLYDDRANGLYQPDGLVRGETSFIDWREQSHPRWMQTADIFQTQTLSTSAVHARAWQVLSEIADTLGHKDVAKDAASQAAEIAAAINKELWMDGSGYYAMYRYGRDNLILNPRAEALGLSLAILWDIADADRAVSITANTPVTPFGVGIFYPQIADMPPYHNNALWPWVAANWALANAKAGNEEGVVEAIGSIFRPAALFTTNKENLVLDNGDIATELNSSNMLWCLSGNLAMTHKILFGINFTKDGLMFKPFVPKALADARSLKQFPYRGAMLDISIEGSGDSIASFTVNGYAQKPLITPQQAAKAKGKTLNVNIVMANNPINHVAVNHQANKKAPLTPIVRLEGTEMVWDPIEYIAGYAIVRDGQVVDTVRTTTYDVSIPGEYQVIGLADDHTPSFASQPVSTRPVIVADFEGEGLVATSSEIAYPIAEVAGYRGKGFVETDNNSAAPVVIVDVPQDGLYSLAVRYANGNGPVNTENRCAVRTPVVDGQALPAVVLPQRGRGNWSDWGLSNTVEVPLKAGRHEIRLEKRAYNTNMNIDTNHALVDAIVLTLKR